VHRRLVIIGQQLPGCLQDSTAGALGGSYDTRLDATYSIVKYQFRPKRALELS
jgi:hypothetical protein